MKKSIIWITAGIAAIGFGVPAFAAHGDSPSDITPTRDTVTTNSVDDSVTTNSVDDSVTTNSVDDSVTTNSVDDSVTTNSVEDISGPCDEAEHATDPRCSGAASSTDDNSGHDSADDSSGHNSTDDSSGHDGGDDSGHGGSDD
jgi:hypothetical protein